MLIQSTKNAAFDRLKFLIYGKPGAGKTYLAKTIGEPTLLISAEAGHLVLSDSDIDMIDMSTDDEGNLLKKELRFNRLLKIYQFIQTEEVRKKYKWIYIDSISEISQNLLENLQSKPEFNSSKKALPMWGEYAKQMRGLIKAFRDLPYYHVVFTAISEEIKSEDGGEVSRGVLISGKISQQIGMYFDEFFYLGVRTNADGEEERLLLTSSTSSTEAKDRSGKLDKYEKPDLSLIAKKIRGEVSKKGEEK